MCSQQCNDVYGFWLMSCLTLLCRSILAPLERSSCTTSVWPQSLASMRAVWPFWGDKTYSTIVLHTTAHLWIRYRVKFCPMSSHPWVNIAWTIDLTHIWSFEKHRYSSFTNRRWIKTIYTYGWQNEIRWHYATLPGSMESLMSMHRQTCTFKITLTYSLTWQTDCCTPWRMAFEVILNAKAALS